MGWKNCTELAKIFNIFIWKIIIFHGFDLDGPICGRWHIPLNIYKYMVIMEWHSQFIIPLMFSITINFHKTMPFSINFFHFSFISNISILVTFSIRKILQCTWVSLSKFLCFVCLKFKWMNFMHFVFNFKILWLRLVLRLLFRVHLFKLEFLISSYYLISAY